VRDPVDVMKGCPNRVALSIGGRGLRRPISPALGNVFASRFEGSLQLEEDVQPSWRKAMQARTNLLTIDAPLQF